MWAADISPSAAAPSGPHAVKAYVAAKRGIRHRLSGYGGLGTLSLGRRHGGPAGEDLMGAVVACATCGTELRENARFCDSCGSAIEASPRVAEDQQVTVLFADVGHSQQTGDANVVLDRW